MRNALTHLKAADPALAAVMDRVGPYVQEFSQPVFASLARSIVFQQLSTRAASTIYGRLQAALAPHPVEAWGILRCTPEQLRSFGLSTAKAAYVRSLAEKTLDGTVDFARLPELPDSEVIAHLTQVKGVGEWTAQMFLMFALRRPDVLPCADLGIRNAMKAIYRMRELPKPARMEKVARPWRPYASVACWYLWRSLDNPAKM
ncbi:MAG: DNA-3-methyladenine glycosylase 2 family protein [Bryobacterales bacterium]|nr:DNA-3-methyladenine glycosylase 2 family protein [Bryobacterales bacterium]